MNIYIPLNTVYRYPQPFDVPALEPNPIAAARKVEVLVNLDPDIFCLLDSLKIETSISHVLVHGGLVAEMERLLTMGFYSFRMLKGKRSSWAHGYKAGFIGQYVFLDRRGFGLAQSNAIAADLKRAAQDVFERTFQTAPHSLIVQSPLLAVIGGRFESSARSKAIRQRMLSLGSIGFNDHQIVAQAA